ncbi:hypothetical protein NQ318_000569 [Aromia moschata]|uniref:Uncharacterized protein n=1 Tax=Aromia moschata TaxID=1265417 RepID=A0AAV8XNE1_9CUCU|nr:hypothetical protein NQ318_000569 [Aromia moschata]
MNKDNGSIPTSPLFALINKDSYGSVNRGNKFSINSAKILRRQLLRIFKSKTMFDYNISDGEELSSTPPDIREKATNAIENILPEK